MVTIDTGNTAWVLVAATLVFFMTPGLALFYGGMERSKNVLNTIMESFLFNWCGFRGIYADRLHLNFR